MSHDFKAACSQFEHGLLEPTELFILANPFIGMYVAAALIDTLAAAHLASNKSGNRNDYKNFVHAYMPDYGAHAEEVYHVLRCGLLHGSRLDILTATPPPGVMIHPVAITPDENAPYYDAGTLMIGASHFMKAIRRAFATFAGTSDPSIIANFPQRFELVIKPVHVMAANSLGAITSYTRWITGGP